MPNNIYKTLTSSQMNEARIHWHPLTSTDIHWQSSGRKFHPLKSTENDCQSVQWLHVKRSPYNPCFWSAPDWHKMHFSDLLSFPAITRTAAPMFRCSELLTSYLLSNQGRAARNIKPSLLMMRKLRLAANLFCSPAGGDGTRTRMQDIWAWWRSAFRVRGVAVWSNLFCGHIFFVVFAHNN